MALPRTDVTGIGNAIVDIIAKCDDVYLSKIGAAKGSMRLVGQQEIAKIYDGAGPATEISGGSAANTIAGLASFGAKTAFIGTIADDEFGRIFTHDIRSTGVAFDAKPIAGHLPTSRSLILVTPDGERTMNTFLGISTIFTRAQIDKALIANSAILYLEGYLFDSEDAKAAFYDAIAIARSAGCQVALSLSDAFCVDRHRAEFLKLIKSGVDILFANESEIISLYQTPSFEAAATAARKDIKLAALTRSAKGSIVLSLNGDITIAPQKAVSVVDTTGAGDLYAAGFLFGISQQLPLKTCGELGSLAAAEIISHTGARPAQSLSQLAREHNLIS